MVWFGVFWDGSGGFDGPNDLRLVGVVVKLVKTGNAGEVEYQK